MTAYRGTGDGHCLALSARQSAHVDRQIRDDRPQVREPPDGLFFGAALVEEAQWAQLEPIRFLAQHDVRGCREIVTKEEVLGDRLDPKCAGGMGREVPDPLRAEPDLAQVGPQ
jgi:hypothetical protein